MKEPDEQLIRAELVKFTTAVPSILSVIVVDRTINGWPVAFVSRDDSFSEDSMVAMINDYYRLAIKVVDDLWLGDFKYFTAVGAETLSVILPLTEVYGMVLVVQTGTRLDTFFATIQPHCESLLKYLSD